MFNGEKVILVNNHFNSKGGDDPLYGVNQPPVEVTQAQRLAQAEVVANFVELIYAVDEDANVVVLGDLNDFGFSKPVERLERRVSSTSATCCRRTSATITSLTAIRRTLTTSW